MPKMASVFSMTPFIPSQEAITKSGLDIKERQLIEACGLSSRGLASSHRKEDNNALALEDVFHSNAIEGNMTKPERIREAAKGLFGKCNEAEEREAVALLHADSWMTAQSLTYESVYSTKFILQLHERLYQHMPDEKCWLRQGDDQVRVIPGSFRERSVSIGEHIPPTNNLAILMARFMETYHPDRHLGRNKVLTVFAAHHRLLWIHPFLDGNGRIGRLFMKAGLLACGVSPLAVWSLNKALFENQDRYKLLLSNADQPRQGNYDGRGALTEKGLIDFCQFMFNAATASILQTMWVNS